ncbi:hypothetical protein SAMN05216489_05437 [Streptomyces sp. 3213]|uniref:hypothetical protein n=1 Tax=Streptomyces sp. 3213.3 TaxID=1855348 RepID=UPI000894E55A|nr:hypothetical protein [Streptomyces sp. 3213.3]SEE08027.1 hypothetical protein SAMN05216489_05437 [Streptomyces sp. 3213] [Streptomyces sp. 3213.3]
MYALILPASTPFVLLATVLGLSWWEDRILPTPEPVEALIEDLLTPATPGQLSELPRIDTALTRDVAGR